MENKIFVVGLGNNKKEIGNTRILKAIKVNLGGLKEGYVVNIIKNGNKNGMYLEYEGNNTFKHITNTYGIKKRKNIIIKY